jgi:hypothetical protein
MPLANVVPVVRLGHTLKLAVAPGLPEPVLFVYW